MKPSRLLARHLKFLVTVLLLTLILFSVDVSAIRRNLADFNAGVLLVLLAVCWAGQLLCSERWRILAASLAMKGSYRTFVQMYFVGMFFNIGLPSLVGGDVIKAYILSRKTGKPFGTGLVSALQDRIAGLISLLLYGTLAVLVNPIVWRGLSLWVVYLLCWTALALAIWLAVTGGECCERFLFAEPQTPIQKGLRLAADFRKALGTTRLAPATVLRVALYSLLNSGMILWSFRQVTVASGHSVSMAPFCALFPLVTLASMLPITLAGLGLREWVYMEALSLVGISRADGLFISLATSALLILCNLAGVFFVFSIPVELRRKASTDG